MPGAARLQDTIQGTVGEHSGHTDPPCSPMTLSGNISGNCSYDVYINGRQAAFNGSTTTEYDGCCGQGSGKAQGKSTTVFINGKAAARNGDPVYPHAGSATITSGSFNVFIG